MLRASVRVRISSLDVSQRDFYFSRSLLYSYVKPRYSTDYET